ncbi:hypothetical protein B0T24DRAFT_635933 [Lasiosphaeria ovina]|uniref:CBM1 domain-containing protein n=1 Tax=Lasiosphaeria ovina TaxID=92902 RepID=A0AAE0JWZ0_9PEZI|nr:hypothetical protein B0T24DRAFT_635933 [Lasiosphaeria ovina]
MVQLLLLLPLLAASAEAQRWTTRWRPSPNPTTSQRQASPTLDQPQSATQSLYGQCGGQTWKGPTSCPVGAYCKNNPDNVWYSQCVASDGSSPAVPSDPGVIIRTLTTVFSVGGPTPTVISTRITYLTPKPSSTKTTSASVVTLTLVPDDPCQDEFYC